MKLTTAIAGCACALASCLTASAQVLMLDFGPTTASGTDRLNSPYHTANSSFTDTSWNTIGAADVSSGLLYSNAAAATGISVNLGATTADGVTMIGIDTVPSNATGLTGSAMTSGVYAGTAPGRDGIFTGSNGSSSRYVGAQIGGLSAGTYDIYLTGRNTNTTAGHEQNFYAGKSSAAGNFDASTLATLAITYYAAPTSQNDVWSGSGGLINYAKFSVTLTSGEFLNLAVRGGTGDARGFLNSIQIVNTSTIPEPSSFALLAGLLGLGTTALRRRR